MSRRKTRNDFIVDGSVARLMIEHKGETHPVLIDASDLPAVIGHKWSIGDGRHGYLFVQTTAWKKGEGAQQTIRLSRFLLNPPRDKMVDHINHDTLDNRRCNLRIVTASGNAQNLSGPKADNRSTGVLNVSMRHGKFIARVQSNHRKYFLGAFDSLDEAAEVVCDFRRRNLPLSKEARNQ